MSHPLWRGIASVCLGAALRAGAGVVFSLMVTGGLVGCGKSAPPPAPPPPNVTVAHPVQREVMEWDEYTGHMEAVEYVEVRARVGGLIVSAPFQEGSIVEQGALLVELDVRPFQAELESRIADEQRASAQVELARITYDHMKELMPSQSASAIEYQQAEATLREMQAAQAGAKAAVEAARLNVEWCRVTAPIRGRIGRKFVTPGNLVTEGAQGTLLTTITSIDPIYCYVDADERSVLKYQRLAREGKRASAREAQIPCFLQLADETGFPHAGYIDFVDNRIDPTTGTIQGRAVFSNADGYLTPGLFARLRVPGSGTYTALLVPDAAVVTDQAQKLLLTIDEQHVVQPRPVTVGAQFGELRAILSGIQPSDRVIILGLLQARPGSRVTPREGAFSVPSIVTIPQGGAISQPTTSRGEAER